MLARSVALIPVVIPVEFKIQEKTNVRKVLGRQKLGPYGRILTVLFGSVDSNAERGAFWIFVIVNHSWKL